MRVKVLAAVLAACVVLLVPDVALAAGTAPLTPQEQAHDQEILQRISLRRPGSASPQPAAEAPRQDAAPEAQQAYDSAYDDYVRQRADYLRRRNAYEGSMDLYAQEHRTYESRLADWQREVTACRSGESTACER